MRTDVKIGVATGLLLVIALVASQLIFNTNGDRTAKDGNSNGEQVAVGPGPGGNGAPAERPGPGLPRFGIVPSTPPTGKAPSPVEPVIPSIRETPPAIEPAPVIPSIRETPPAIEPAPVIPSIRETPPAVGPGPVIPSIRETVFTPDLGVPPVGPAAEGTYEVQKGDSGFWAIAEKKYGDGKYYYLIAKANPNVSSNSLRPGQKLVIPAKPIGPTEPSTHGGVEISPTGQRVYVVRKGDAGFWAIAQKEYGDGKYYYLIAKANPNANSNSLRPGDKLVLPDKPAATTPAALAATPLIAGLGGKIYTITKEDTTGLWGIAKKEYGNGAYWKIIAQANPKVDTSGLRVGQQLIVPALTEEAKSAVGAGLTTRPGTGRAPTPAPAPAAKRTDIEDLGPTPRFR